MGHKHEIEVYVMVDEVAALSVEEQCAFFKDKLQKYACMMDIIQGEYEKAYLEVRRTRGLPVYSDTMFKEEVPKASAAEEQAIESVPEVVMPEMPEAVMPEMVTAEPEPEPFVPETIEEHADAILESIEAMGLPEEPVAEIPVEVPAVEEVAPEALMSEEMPAVEETAPEALMPEEMPAVEVAVPAEIPVEAPAAEEALPVEMSPDEIAAMLAAAQATA